MKNNPYVGPRPYEQRDRHNFHGRDREARELRALIVAEREVLFYAQSGAGKTSLLNAMVIPALEEKSFRVLPVARVGSDLPPDIRAEDVDNIFVFSALLALTGEDIDPQTLLHHTLCQFIEETYPASEDEFDFRPLVLIFDQFEELFTTHRSRWQDAEGFFVQVRQALDALPRLGVVFTMREDYVAELDSYIPLFPRRLRARFRMERLGPKGALAAVEKPALDAGCPFEPGVAQRLVDNLRLIKVRRQAGAREETVAGPSIEPVQLQVVCRRLWDNLPEQKDSAIQWQEVEQYGDVDQALTDFYESALLNVMQGTRVRERTLRRWFSEQLITSIGTRGLVMQGGEDTAGLPNAAVDVLERLHLIRADVRAGARWYELTHDRFVEPIQESNKSWHDVRRRTLFTTLAATVAVLVVVFVAAWTTWQRAEARASAAAAESEMWISVARTRVRPLKPGLSVSGDMATAGTIGAFVRHADGGFCLVSASDVLGVPGLRTLQPGRTDGGQVPDDVIGHSALHSTPTDGAPTASLTGLACLTEDTPFETTIPGIGPIRGAREPTPGASVRLLGRTSGLVTGKIEEAGVTSTVYPGTEPLRFLNGIIVSAKSEAGDGGALVVDEEGYAIGIVVAGSRSEVIVAPIQDVTRTLGVQLLFAGQHLFTLPGHQSRVLAAAWSPDGARVATGGENGIAYLWDVKTEEIKYTLRGHRGAVTAIAISPDGRWLVTGSEDATARLWDLAAPNPGARPIVLQGHELGVTTVALSPDSHWLVTGSRDATVRVWDLTAPDPGALTAVIRGHQAGITAVAISPDGYSLATGNEDNTVRTWNLDNLRAGRGVVRYLESPILDLAFSSDGRRLTAASADAKATSWDMGSGDLVAEFTWPVGEMIDMAWSPGGQQVVVVSGDGLAGVWDAASGELLFSLEGHTGSVLRAAWSPDGIRIVTAGSDGTARIWQGR